MSALRPEVKPGNSPYPAPKGGTAYLMLHAALETQDGLIHGRLHGQGRHCAIGSFWTVNPKTPLYDDFIDEVAAVNDSVPHYTPRKRKLHVQRWLRWKLTQLGMPGLQNQEAVDGFRASV